MQGSLPAPSGTFTMVKSYDVHAMRKALVRDDEHGHFRKERFNLLAENWSESRWRDHFRSFLRDNVHSALPRWWYEFLIGHDLHISMHGRLSLKHFHSQQVDPFTGEMGWLENVGLVSVGKITTAYRDFLALMHVTDATTIGDFKYHEVGTDATAEANSQTALIVTSGIARATGNQSNPSGSTYLTVATITADATETWNEHGLFNASTGPTMMDRSLISSPPAVVSGDTLTASYTATFNAES